MLLGALSCSLAFLIFPQGKLSPRWQLTLQLGSQDNRFVDPLDSLEKTPHSQLTGQFVGVNCVLFYITGMLQSTVM